VQIYAGSDLLVREKSSSVMSLDELITAYNTAVVNLQKALIPPVNVEDAKAEAVVVCEAGNAMRDKILETIKNVSNFKVWSGREAYGTTGAYVLAGNMADAMALYEQAYLAEPDSFSASTENDQILIRGLREVLKVAEAATGSLDEGANNG
jgi:hypothetical protein